MSLQQVPWEEFERDSIERWECPYSGLALIRREHSDGRPNPTGSVASCDVCDCFGYDLWELPRIEGDN